MLHDQLNIRKYAERKKSIYRFGMNQTCTSINAIWKHSKENGVHGIWRRGELPIIRIFKSPTM